MGKIIMFNKKQLIIAVVLVVAIVAIFAYILFLRPSSETEVVYAATEVGTPNGPAVTKGIGPAGGSLASPDGRLTLTVPPNALTETVAFTIQPITNKARNGLGLAYRLEPNGKTFTTALEISVHYDEHDLAGTIPEALSLAYQDQKGAWHAQKSAKLDQTARTLTVATTHFTDEAFLARLRMIPPAATLHVGESKVIQLVECGEQNFVDKILSRPLKYKEPPQGGVAWSLRGAGTIKVSALWQEERIVGVAYTAPAKQPTPNVAWVDLKVKFYFWDQITGETSTGEKTLSAKITIVNQGYRASGKMKTGDTFFSGVICDLEDSFTIETNNPYYSSFDFVPSSPTTGAYSFAGKSNLYGAGGGEYTIEGTDALKTGIAMNNVRFSGYFQASGRRIPTSTTGGKGHIDLVPLDTECK